MYRRYGRIDYLESAIQCERKALRVTPMDSPERLIRMNDLAVKLKHRCERIGNPEDINEAVETMETFRRAIAE